jgi:U3 small nucleolar RNA-associated protein 11
MHVQAGVHKAESAATGFKIEDLKVMKGQDRNYLQAVKSAEDKKIERLQATLHAMPTGRQNQHTIFVDDEAAAHAFDPAEYFKTDSSLLDRTYNRPTRDMLAAEGAFDNTVADQKKRKRLQKDTDKSYHELETRQDRSMKIGKIVSQIDMERELLQKGRRKKVQDADRVAGTPAVYKWKAERRR